MIKNYNDFKNNQNESMKKFSNLSKDKKTPKVEELKKDDNFLDYQEEVNVDILKQQRPKKPATKQTNIQDTKKFSEISTKTVKAPRETNMNEEGEEVVKESRKVKKVGKIAKFPKGTKASNAYNYLEDVKISKNKIWYILIEKQDSELQMVKYATKKGVNLTEFINGIKDFYIDKYSNEDTKSLIEKINVAGDKEGNFSMIKNIPNIKVDGVKLIRKLTEDLTKLLSGELGN